jgi:predicted MFS family arabinose efflux permease
MATVALFTEMMSHCRVGAEGGDYTLQASVVVVCTGLAAALSGFSAARLGYPLHFLLGALAALAGAALALLGTQRHSQVRPAP